MRLHWTTLLAVVILAATLLAGALILHGSHSSSCTTVKFHAGTAETRYCH